MMPLLGQRPILQLSPLLHSFHRACVDSAARTHTDTRAPHMWADDLTNQYTLALR